MHAFVSSRTKRPLAAALAALLLLASLAVPVGSAAEEEEASPIFTPTETALLSAVDPAFLLKHVEYVHNNIGPRYFGSPADEASADYFASVFEELGYAPFTEATASDGEEDYFETFECDQVKSHIGGSVTIGGREYTAAAPTWSDSSVYQGYNTPTVTGDTVYFETVAETLAAEEQAVSGKVVLTNRESTDVWGRSSTAYADAARTLQGKGALALVFFYCKYSVSEKGGTSSEREFPPPTSGDPITIPVVLVPYLDGRTIVKSLTVDGAVQSAEATVVNRRSTETSNVLAVKEASVPTDKYVLIGAHRDSVFGAEGADDNLSGTVNVLGVANALREIPTAANVIFALWGAEEEGLLGSEFFYSDFLYPEDWGKQHVIAYYNMDMAATSQTRNSVLTIHTPYRDAERNPLRSEAGDVAAEQAERYWRYADGSYGKWWTKGHDDLLVDLQYYGSCSDHAAITGATGANDTPKLAFGEGIPAVYMFWGDRLGDGTNDVTEQNYHVVGDNYAWPEDEDVFTVFSDDKPYTGNYSVERATILASVFALSVYNTAASPLEGVTDGEEFDGDTTFTVSYNYREGATLDGEPLTLSQDGSFVIPADSAAHTLTFHDLFGQERTVTVTVYRTFTVRFEADGEVVGEYTVREGSALEDIPTPPAKKGYTLTPPKWSSDDFGSITEDRTVTAEYTKDNGDISGDGETTIEDASTLLFYLANPTSPAPAHADLTADGKVTTKDLSRLLDLLIE